MNFPLPCQIAGRVFLLRASCWETSRSAPWVRDCRASNLKAVLQRIPTTKFMRPKPVKQALSKITTAKAVPCASPRSKAVVLSPKFFFKHDDISKTNRKQRNWKLKHIFVRHLQYTFVVLTTLVWLLSVSVRLRHPCFFFSLAPHETNPSIKGGDLNQGPHGWWKCSKLRHCCDCGRQVPLWHGYQQNTKNKDSHSQQ